MRGFSEFQFRNTRNTLFLDLFWKPKNHAKRLLDWVNLMWHINKNLGNKKQSKHKILVRNLETSNILIFNLYSTRSWILQNLFLKQCYQAYTYISINTFGLVRSTHSSNLLHLCLHHQNHKDRINNFPLFDDDKPNDHIDILIY